MDERRTWPALVLEAPGPGFDDVVAVALDDCSPAAIEDLVPQPLPPDGLWDPTYPPPPEPPPSPLRWRVFFHTVADRARAAAALRAGVPDLAIAFLEVEDENWAARSQRELTAVHAGAFVVAPPWDVPASADPEITTIVIEPSRGFGTGHHASTRLCLRALSTVDVRGKRVLDLGTGSGVLAMAAALNGARAVIGVDVDQDAIDSARYSATLNVIPIALEWRVADFRDGLGIDPCDIVVANLTGGMLTSSAAAIGAFVVPGGTLIASGFDRTEETVVRGAFADFSERARFDEAGWISVVLQQRG